MENGKRVRKDENNIKSIAKDIITEIICIASKIKFKVLYLIGKNETANMMCDAIRTLSRRCNEQQELLNHIVEMCESNFYGKPELRLKKIKEEIVKPFPNE